MRTQSLSFSYGLVEILYLEGVLLQLLHHLVYLLFQFLVLLFQHVVEDALLALFVLVAADVGVVWAVSLRVGGGAAVARFIVMR